MSVLSVPAKFRASFLPLSPLVRRAVKVGGLCLLGYTALWLAATLGMLGVHVWAGKGAPTGAQVAGINHFQQVDDRLWRGSAPDDAGYRALADRGVRTVVDLRAEDLSARALASPARAGLTSVHMPIRDGQTPTSAQVDTFLRTMKAAAGPVFVHCSAGVGRTGSITAAYLVRTGQAGSQQVALKTLAIGPPSIEQVYYVLSADRHHSQQPPAVVEALSRLLDAPRRISASL